MRLLFCDDEELIADGLYNIFSSLDAEYEVYKAYSGLEAIGYLNKYRFDIVVSDIKMPEMSGIALKNAIIERWPWCKIIFLTGHSEFEYVYDAIQSNNVRFLLKTEDTDKLIETVAEVALEIEEENKLEQLAIASKEEISKSKDIFLNNYFIGIINGKFKLETSTIDKLGLNFNLDQPILAAVGRLGVKIDDYYLATKTMTSIKKMLMKKLFINLKATIITDMDLNVYILFQPKNIQSEDEYAKAIIFVQGIIESVQNSLYEEQLNFLVSSTSFSMNDLSNALRELKIKLNEEIGTASEVLILDNVNENDILTDSIDIAEQKITNMLHSDRLIRFLEMGQKELFLVEISPYIVFIRQSSIDNLHALEIFQTIFNVIVKHVNNYRINSADIHESINRLLNLSSYQSFDHAISILIKMVESICEQREIDQINHTEKIINSVEHYVREHIKDDLSLVTLAEVVYLNPAYLSRLYKQVRGVNLSYFIDKQRISAAKELLLDTNKKILDIAKIVGYENAASFSRLFKKNVGITPQEYREDVKK
jgi:two-component system response regulator YesN